MATKKTYAIEVTCDVCAKKEILCEGESQSISSVSCAVRGIGYCDEYGNFHEKNKPMLSIKDLDLCPSCKKKACTKIISETSQMHSSDLYYTFFNNTEQEEA